MCSALWKGQSRANNISVMSIDVQKSITHYWLIIAFFYMIEKACAVVFDEFCCSAYFKNRKFLYWKSFDELDACCNHSNNKGVFHLLIGQEMAVALKWCIFDPKLVKPKCVWEIYIFVGRISFLKKSLKMKKYSKSTFFWYSLSRIRTWYLRHISPESYL